ncbi:hypothetical protein HK101_002697 [Irineochytrium annulatum]|nr:hypothetical protein HK101_002697 [Irineochytrium annulatum]
MQRSGAGGGQGGDTRSPVGAFLRRPSIKALRALTGEKPPSQPHSQTPSPLASPQSSPSMHHIQPTRSFDLSPAPHPSWGGAGPATDANGYFAVNGPLAGGFQGQQHPQQQAFVVNQGFQGGSGGGGIGMSRNAPTSRSAPGSGAAGYDMQQRERRPPPPIPLLPKALTQRKPNSGDQAATGWREDPFARNSPGPSGIADGAAQRSMTGKTPPSQRIDAANIRRREVANSSSSTSSLLPPGSPDLRRKSDSIPRVTDTVVSNSSPNLAPSHLAAADDDDEHVPRRGPSLRYNPNRRRPSAPATTSSPDRPRRPSANNVTPSPSPPPPVPPLPDFEMIASDEEMEIEPHAQALSLLRITANGRQVQSNGRATPPVNPGSAAGGTLERSSPLQTLERRPPVEQQLEESPLEASTAGMRALDASKKSWAQRRPTGAKVPATAIDKLEGRSNSVKRVTPQTREVEEMGLSPGTVDSDVRDVEAHALLALGNAAPRFNWAKVANDPNVLAGTPPVVLSPLTPESTPEPKPTSAVSNPHTQPSNRASLSASRRTSMQGKAAPRSALQPSGSGHQRPARKPTAANARREAPDAGSMAGSGALRGLDDLLSQFAADGAWDAEQEDVPPRAAPVVPEKEKPVGKPLGGGGGGGGAKAAYRRPSVKDVKEWVDAAGAPGRRPSAKNFEAPMQVQQIGAEARKVKEWAEAVASDLVGFEKAVSG